MATSRVIGGALPVSARCWKRKPRQRVGLRAFQSRIDADQWDHFGSKSLQARNAVSNGFAAEVEDQLVHANGTKGADVASDIIGAAGKASAGAVTIRDGSIVQRRLIGDGQRGKIPALGCGQPLQRI